MRSLGLRQTLSGCLNAHFPDELGNGADDNGQTSSCHIAFGALARLPHCAAPVSLGRLFWRP
jgi:hypothetical protein